MPDLFKGLAYFEKISGRKLTKTLVYAGSENQERSQGKVKTWKNPFG
jgi:hypothetical protein